MKKLLRSAVLGAALVVALSGSVSAAPAGGPVPPKPDYCKNRTCVLGCYMPGPVRNISTNVPVCNRLGRPLYWFVRR